LPAVLKLCLFAAALLLAAGKTGAPPPRGTGEDRRCPPRIGTLTVPFCRFLMSFCRLAAVEVEVVGLGPGCSSVDGEAASAGVDTFGLLIEVWSAPS
jgi:hypothetical protein